MNSVYSERRRGEREAHLCIALNHGPKHGGPIGFITDLIEQIVAAAVSGGNIGEKRDGSLQVVVWIARAQHVPIHYNVETTTARLGQGLGQGVETR